MQNKNNKIRTQSTAGHHWSFSAVRQRKRGQDRFSSSIMILWHCESWDLQLAKIEYLCSIRRLWRGVLKELTFWTMQVPWTAQATAMVARCHDGHIGIYNMGRPRTGVINNCTQCLRTLHAAHSASTAFATWSRDTKTDLHRLHTRSGSWLPHYICMDNKHRAIQAGKFEIE